MPVMIMAQTWTGSQTSLQSAGMEPFRRTLERANYSKVCCPGDEWPIDPREQKLGYRKIMGENDKPKAEAAFLEPGLAPVESEADAYKVWRLQKGIAEGSEIPSGQAKLFVVKPKGRKYRPLCNCSGLAEKSVDGHISHSQLHQKRL